jgi:hypothetical protein
VSQLDGLRSEHCGFGQGFIFARPQAPEAIEPLLTRSTEMVNGPAGAVAPGLGRADVVAPIGAGAGAGAGDGAGDGAGNGERDDSLFATVLMSDAS